MRILKRCGWLLLLAVFLALNALMIAGTRHSGKSRAIQASAVGGLFR